MPSRCRTQRETSSACTDVAVRPLTLTAQRRPDMVARMSTFRNEQKSIVVVTAPSAARAELIQMTLAAHGISATMSVPSVYPSVDFVEGVGVSVRIEDELRAREVLNALGLGGSPDSEEETAEDG